MLANQEDKPFLKRTQNKVIAAFLLACAAILLALSITYYSFEGLLTTVDDLTTPNAKLNALNTLFHRIIELDQQQRADAIRNPQKSQAEFLTESKSIVTSIDSLMNMDWENDRQFIKLQYMEEILHRRDEIFLSYLKLKSEIILNKKLSNRLDKLSAIISKSYSDIDTTVTTTQKKITTTTYPASNKAAETSFIKRLFSKKKNAPADTRIEVQEELSVKIDTLAMTRQDSAIAEVGHIMKNLEKDQRLQNHKMLEGELDLIATNTVLISELLNTLRDVEKQEQAAQLSNTAEAAVLVSTSIKRIGIIMIVFFLLAALLVFLIITDITKSNSLRQQLIKAKEEAEHLSRIKQRFLANMSHEIRTPLQSIIGYAEQLRQQESSEQHAVEAIHNSSEHLLHIVNEVLDYSRLESGKLTINVRPFNLLELLHEVKSVIGMQAERKNILFLLETQVSPSLNLLGDPFRLRQILYNLLGNAIKFTDTGHVKLTVDVEEASDKIHCRFTVADTGIGMHQHDIERVFELFEQVNNTSRPHEGTGLGLTIVKKLVEAQDGKLHVESELGSGSAFSVELHYQKAIIENTTPFVSLIDSPYLFEGEVMVVDDDPLILKLCSLILQKHGIKHVTFNESDMALQQNIDDSLKVIFLDIRMPRIDGIELCRALRKKVNSHTKIIALTAHVLPQERALLVNSGFDHILTKPFREAELLELLGIQDQHPDKVLQPENYFSLPTLQQMTMGDEELFQSVLSQFIDETQDDSAKLEKYFADLNQPACKEIIHRLAGRIGQVGVIDLSDQLKNFELEIGERDLIALSEKFNLLIKEIKILLDKSKNLLTVST